MAIVAKTEDTLIKLAGAVVLALLALMIWGAWRAGSSLSWPDSARPDSLFSRFVGFGMRSFGAVPVVGSKLQAGFGNWAANTWPVVDKLPGNTPIVAPSPEPVMIGDLTLADSGNGNGPVVISEPDLSLDLQG